MASAENTNDDEQPPSFPVPIFFEGNDDVESEKRPSRGGSQTRSRLRSRGKSSRGQRGRGRGEDIQLLHLPHRIPRIESSEDNRPNTGYKRGNLNARSRGRVRGRGRGSDNSESSDRKFSDKSNETKPSTYSYVDIDELLEQKECGNESKRVKKGREFSETILIVISKKDNPDEVLLDIGNSKSGFVEFIRKPLDPQLVYYLIRLLCNVSDAKIQDTRRREILQEVETHFLHKLTELLNDISLKVSKTFHVWNSSENLRKLLINISKLLRAIITTLPSSLGKCKGVITAVKEVIEEHRVEGAAEALQDVEEVLKREKQTRQNSRTGDGENSNIISMTSTDKLTEETEHPPNNFREISIFPTLDDFQEDFKPFLRANKDVGKYENLDNYLDVQFRLLREDYMKPLRKGIVDYKHCIKNGMAVTKLKDIRLYQSVQILHPVCSGKGINHMLQFDLRNFSKVNWASSRRLLHGSLVCLSKDNFDTIIYATITERNPEELALGNIQVHFEDKNEVLAIRPTDVYTMAETTAYFEAYRHVLKGLQEMDDKMPLQRYVVACELDVKPPDYLQKYIQVLYDFASLLTGKERNSCLIPVLQRDVWPSAAELNLDSSQYEALQQATTKELAIIQGPPGTGKTFVGLKIVQLLLNNFNQWTEPKERCPILVVCYTNHALDQFLEGVLQFSNDKLIRIGGRCKNENLEPFVLRNIKQKRKENNERSFSMTQSEKDHFIELKNSEKQIVAISNRIKQTAINIIQYGHLKHFMTDSQQEMFETAGDETFLKTCISLWIGIFEQNEESLKNKPKGQQFKQVWEQTILQTVRQLPRNERDYLNNVWDLDTGRRAELYKTWISELTENAQNELCNNTKKTKQTRKKERHLQQLIQTASESILDIETLMNNVVSLKTKQEIQSLLSEKRVPKGILIRFWLDLLGSDKSIPYIKDALENLSLNYENGFKDDELSEERDEDEEDRRLEEDDDFLLEYSDRKSKDKSKNKKDDDAWILVMNAKQTAYKVKILLTSAKELSQEEAISMANVWKLDQSKRRDLYRHWVFQYRKKLKDFVQLQEQVFNNATEKLDEVRNTETFEIMRDADVIGLTTTGAAKNRRLLKLIQPKIIVVEEAAEVLESHIITTLNENCQHLILIGDHKQLRPSTTVYELSKKYKLDVSFFERMVRNNVPYITLQEQHRMRPEISCLLKHEFLYPKLRDHDSVQQYDNILGLDVNIQFINHDEPEQIPEDSTSHCNPHEAQYVAGLCMYLLNQGYNPSQITVITPYMAQVQLLRRAMPKSSYEGVRITAVDNFQGEENDIILVSLVRSSSPSGHGKNKIGFVGIENRICVSLSRAKKGLYVIGNFTLLELNCQLWHDIIQTMKRNGAVKSEMILRCQNHPEKFVLAKEAADFGKCPQGGCGKSCGAELPCGHICPKSCHQIDREHTSSTCERPCEKIVCDEGHTCTKRCWQPCGKCCKPTEKMIPMCGHTELIPCSTDPNDWKCLQICTFILACGHTCKRKCYECKQSEHHEEKCQYEVEKLLPCGHKADMKCHESVNSFKCEAPCKVTLDCNHKCKGNCSSCVQGRIHGSCQKTCENSLPCGHRCSSICSEICPPCSRTCKWVCSHMISCSRMCWQECFKCSEECMFDCEHQTCEKECHEICNNGPCQQRCNKKVACGHICRGLCSESCICISCEGNLVRRGSGEEFDEGAVFIQLPDCSCIIEIHRLDRHMENQVLSSGGKICKSCPHCLRPITKNIRRYTNVLKQIRAQITKDFLAMNGGSDSEREKFARKLKIKVSGLRGFGLTDSEMKSLVTSIKDTNATRYGILNAVNKAADRLKVLLEIERKMCRHPIEVNISAEGGLINPAILRNKLVYMRKFPTKQFWREVDTEIMRHKLGDELLRFREKPRNHDALEEMVILALKVLSEKLIDQEKEKILTEVSGVVKTFLNTNCVDNHVVKNLTVQLSAIITLQEMTVQKDAATADGNRRENIQEMNTSSLKSPNSRPKPSKNVTGIPEDTIIENISSMTRHETIPGARLNQTHYTEISIGSDSVDIDEPSTRMRLQTVVPSDILLGSDSFDSLPVTQRSENTQRQSMTSESIFDTDDTEEEIENDF